MGRPPCCEKVGIKKGPWTPEEDIILVSYIQEHGPGNWRSVPTNTGLSRCSKSCRLRWTNYLRPGIKRGNFTPHEEGMIIHFASSSGWAAIASYLPQRTDNDIKNYWNTHLKKKLKKIQTGLDPHLAANSTTTSQSSVSKSFNNESKSSDMMDNKHGNSSQRLSQSHSSTYASSTENISRLLEGWMRSSPKPDTTYLDNLKATTQDHKELLLQSNSNMENGSNMVMKSALSLKSNQTKEEGEEGGGDMVSHEEFDSILSYENLNNAAWDKSTGDSMPPTTQKSTSEVAAADDKGDKVLVMAHDERNKQRSENSSDPPLSVLEKWLLDENVGQVEEMMELSLTF